MLKLVQECSTLTDLIKIDIQSTVLTLNMFNKSATMSHDTSPQAVKNNLPENAREDLSASYRLYGGILLLLALCSACASGYWFYQSIEYRNQSTELKKDSSKFERMSERSIFGALPGVGAQMKEMELTAESAVSLAILAAEKRAYQFLSLALFLGGVGYALVAANPLKPDQ